MKKIILLASLLNLYAFGISLNEVPKEVTIEKEDGGLLNEEAWNSSMLKGKVHILFYVDPDEKDTNNEFSETLTKQDYTLDKFGTVAIVNLKATWLPNFAIASALEEKQKAYPRTTYVKDKTKYLVRNWGLRDDSSNILIFNKKGELIYNFSGKLPQNEIEKALKLIEENL